MSPVSNRLRGRGGHTIIEALIALVILVAAIGILYQILAMGGSTGSAARSRLAAAKFVDMELERISRTDYDSLPPERHKLRAHVSRDGIRECLITLHHLPVQGSVRITLAGGMPLPPRYFVRCEGEQVGLPAELSGQEVHVWYSYEYPRTMLCKVPGEPPYQVRIGGGRLRAVLRVVGSDGKPLPVIPDLREGILTFRPQDTGKSVSIDYRGAKDEGLVQSRFVSPDLRSPAAADQGFKQIDITESWMVGRETKKMVVSYVRAE